MKKFRRVALSHWVVVGGLAASHLAAMSVVLTPSTGSPAPLGTVVTWNANVSEEDPGTLWYRFRARGADGLFRTLVDFGPRPFLDWTSIAGEGVYEVEVSVKNNSTGEVASASGLFTLTPLALDKTPVITPTANPLVFIYSAAPCPSGSRMRVDFQSADGLLQHTPLQDCDPAHTMNFYLAGMRATTQYSARHVIVSDSGAKAGPDVSLSTPDVFMGPPQVTLLSSSTPSSDGILLQSIFGQGAVATDLSGNIVWFAPDDTTFLTRPQDGGTFIAIGEAAGEDISNLFFREFNLAGVTVAETNAARVNQQLALMGVNPITGFHHDARKLPDGGYLVLAGSERILTDVQGPGDVDVIGDTIVVLDSDLRVTWAWDSFDHLDTRRMAVLGEVCTARSGIACAPFHQATVANDWLHGNSLQLTPDGNILYSARHQDWLIKIDYENGQGSGDVLWRLGDGGDFQIVSDDPQPWFSHQHDGNFAADNTTLLVFDDGNTRASNDPNANSRGQVLQIDEGAKTAKLVLNADLGAYSAAVGSAQLLSNGNYHFDSGFILDSDGNRYSQSLEVNQKGEIVFSIQFGAIEYRSFRLPDLYTAPFSGGTTLR